MKLIRVADLRDIHDQYMREEITFSRYSELLNERAAENLKKIVIGEIPDGMQHHGGIRDVIMVNKEDMVMTFQHGAIQMTKNAFEVMASQLGIELGKPDKATAMDILRELVELTRMSELIKERAQAFITARDNGDTSDLEDEHLIALKEEYNRRKPIAWQRAKDLLLTQ